MPAIFAIALLVLASPPAILAAPVPPASTPDQAPVTQPDFVYRSWQVEHPVLTGVLSTLSLGLWPGEFGADVQRREFQLVMNQGFGQHAYGYVQAASYRIFQWARRITAGLIVVLFVALVSLRLLEPTGALHRSEPGA